MNHWLAQLVLAVRNGNEENGWVQILVFVILAIFYAVGSIAKARANKTASKISHKPARKPPDLQVLKRFFGISEEPESSIQPITEEPEPQVTIQQVRPQGRKIARPAIQQAAEPQVQPKIEKVPEFTVAMPQVEVVMPIETSQYLSEILSDFENPESLRRAILHYEILGKPLSLREPSERFI